MTVLRDFPTEIDEPFTLDTSHDFAGSDYERRFDHERLAGQMRRVYNLMLDHEWRTVQEICDVTHDPGPSVLAQLGHLRKQRFGAHLVEKRPRGDRIHGLWEYRMGEPGAHIPRQNSLLQRALHAETWAQRLAHALHEVVPEHPQLLAYLRDQG